MAHKVIYWVTTGLVAAMSLLSAFAYFAWIAASVAHYLAKDGPKAFMPLILLVFLFVSYINRPADRQWPPKAAVA